MCIRDRDSVSLVSGGNITLNSGATISDSQNNGYIALGATGNFINNAGTSPLNATGTSGRWLVYSASPTNDVFGAMDSANAPVWGQTYATQLPSAVAVTGNRYVFASIPSVSITANSAIKEYGTTTLTAASLLGITSTVSGGSVYTVPTMADVFSALPTAASAGLTATASVAGGPYAITVTPGTAYSGYSVSYATPGSITITPKSLTVTGTTACDRE